MVVGVGQKREYMHLGSLRRQGQTVDEGVGGLPVRTQKELALGAPARDHVHPTRDDSTRHRHPFSSARPPHRCAEINLGAVRCRLKMNAAKAERI